MSTAFTIAHFSDVHLSPLTGFAPRYWNAKRVLGFVNWHRKRRRIHQRGIADRIVADIRAQKPDHIALTGDLINIGLPAEYRAAAQWLDTVGMPADVSVVPGNHDIYTATGREPGVGRWAAYMASDAWGRDIGHGATVGFPYVRRVGPVAIIGLCSAVETPPGAATGRLGDAQLAAVKISLDRLASEPVFRLIMIHHPPLPGMTRPHHELTDADALSRIVAEAGADLILHGHTHRATAVRLERGIGAVPVVGVASASAGVARGIEPLAQYNLLDISGESEAWQIRLRRRGFSSMAEPIRDLEEQAL